MVSSLTWADFGVCIFIHTLKSQKAYVFRKQAELIASESSAELIFLFCLSNLFYFHYRMVGATVNITESPHDKTNKMACAPRKHSDQPRHQPSLIRVFTVRMKKAWVLSYPLSAQRRLWLDWTDAQADLSLCWANSHFVGFVMRWLNYALFTFMVS